MLKYVKGGGKVLTRLVKRRKKEIQLLLSGSSTAINKEFEKISLNQFIINKKIK